MAELAARAGRPLPSERIEDLYRYDSLDSFLSVFWFVQALLRTPSDWERLGYESMVDGAAHGVRYREMFFTPARHLAADADLGAIIEGLDRGLSAAEAETGARCSLILEMDRAYGPVAGLELVDALFSYLANTISFVRVAAFAAVHAGVLVAIFALADTFSQFRFGGMVSILVLVAGNVAVILLEGLTVTVQVLRLEYYEFFSRFFRGGGEPYRPLMLRPNGAQGGLP